MTLPGETSEIRVMKARIEYIILGMEVERQSMIEHISQAVHRVVRAQARKLGGSMRIKYEICPVCFWHTGCEASKLGIGVMKLKHKFPEHDLLVCLHCGKQGCYPVGGVGEMEVPEERDCDCGVCNLCNGGKPSTYPTEHVTAGEECWCDPDIEELEDGALLVIHRDKSEAN